MQPTQLIHDNKLSEYLVNHDHKLIIRITNTARDDNCDVQIHHTNYPELKIIIIFRGPYHRYCTDTDKYGTGAPDE